MIIYYTDGSASPNPGPGGYSVILGDKPAVLGTEPEGSGVSSRQTTNIRMEGFAIMAALKHSAGEPCTIYTDSEFWINVITKWAPGWKAKGWKKSLRQILQQISGCRRCTIEALPKRIYKTNFGN
jgi:ribonuclease HI